MVNGLTPFFSGAQAAQSARAGQRELRRQRNEDTRNAAAFNALAQGDIARAAAFNPQVARQAQVVQQAEQDQQVVNQQRRRDAALRLAQAGEFAVQNGADPLTIFDSLASRSGGLFGSEEELLQTRAFVEELGPEAFGVIRAGLTDRSLTDNTPAAIQEFQFLQGLPEDQQRQFFEIKRNPQTFEIGGARRAVVPGSAGAQTEVLVSPNETAAGERTVREAASTGSAIGEAVVEDLNTKFAEAQDALVTLDQAARARELLGDGIISGSLPQQRLALARVVETATGIEVPESANTSEFNAIVSQFVAENIQAFGAGTGLSDADREFAKAMSAGDLAGGARALESILSITENRARDRVDRFNQRRSSVVERNADFGDLFPEIELSERNEEPANIGQIPAAAIDLLRRDPSRDALREFDEIFGDGAARRALGR